jgi:hypothetical protein
MHYQEIAEHDMIQQRIIFSPSDAIVLNSTTRIKSEKTFSLIELIQRKHRAVLYVFSKKFLGRTLIPV